MIRVSRWPTEYGPLSIEAIRRVFSPDTVFVVRHKCHHARDGWQFGSAREGTWICIGGACRVVFQDASEQRPIDEDAFWRADGIILRRGDMVDFGDARFVLRILDDEIEVELGAIWKWEVLKNSPNPPSQ